MKRTAQAVWTGKFSDGSGTFKSGTGAITGAYSAPTRFGDEIGTNPEELIAAAHAACFSMALTAGLNRDGIEPKSVETTAEVTIEKLDEGWRIVHIHLTTIADIPGGDAAVFVEKAEGAKKGCPISAALAAVPSITLDAKLK
jgi:osmotically inducible protein OsmC